MAKRKSDDERDAIIAVASYNVGYKNGFREGLDALEDVLLKIFMGAFDALGSESVDRAFILAVIKKTKKVIIGSGPV